MNLTATVETAINLTVTELAKVSEAAAAINANPLNLFDTLDKVFVFLSAGVSNPANGLGDRKGWHLHQGGHHVALSRIGGTNGETHRVLLVTEASDECPQCSRSGAGPLCKAHKPAAPVAKSCWYCDGPLTDGRCIACDSPTLTPADWRNAERPRCPITGPLPVVPYIASLDPAKQVTPPSLQSTADALRACTGSVEVTVTDGGQTASSTAPQAPQATNAAIEAGDPVDVFVNQGTREGWVLAVVGDEYLLEYTMPNGTTALQIRRLDGASYPGRSGVYRSVSYGAVPFKWLKAIVDGGFVWEGRGQGGRGKVTEPSAANVLLARVAKTVR